MYLIFSGVINGQCLMMISKANDFQAQIKAHEITYRGGIKIILLVKNMKELALEQEIRTF